MGGDTTSAAARLAYEITVAEVRRRVAAGETNTQIATAIGKSRDVVAMIRRKRLGLGRRRLPLTAEERAELDQRILRGDATRDLAKDFAIHRGTIARLKRALADRTRTEAAPCRCGKAAGHRGRCDLVIDPTGIRQRILAGQTATEIAREFNRTAQSFKPKYVDPVIATLTVEGYRCACGSPFGHRDACHHTVNRHRMPDYRAGASPADAVSAPKRIGATTKLSDEQLIAIKRRYRDGASIRSISRASGIAFTVVQRVVNQLKEASTYGYAPCVCGRPARHPGGCIKNTPRALHKRWAQRIESRILEGKTVREIADELRLKHETVFKYARPAREKLLEAGVRCPCGQEVGHRYWCSATWDRFEMPRGHIPLEAKLEREIKKALIRGDVAAAIAETTGIGTPTIFRIRRELPLADLKRRRRVMRERFAMSDDAYSRDVLDRINRVVRAPSLNRKGEARGTDYAKTLEDIRNDIYLAVMEGRIEALDIEIAAKRMLRQDWWDRKRGGPSADEIIGGDGGPRLADLLRDDTFSASLDVMAIGADLTDPP